MTTEDVKALPLAALGGAQGLYRYGLRDLPPAVGWGLVAASVVAWDVLEHKTLTHGMHEALNKHPVLTRAMIGAVAVHLALPKLDPISLVYDLFK